MNRQARWFALCGLAVILAINLNGKFVAADVAVITVAANQDVPRSESSYYEHLERKHPGHVQMNVTNDFHFFVIQIHTFINNVSISSTENFEQGSYVAGNDVGLVQFKVPDKINYDFYLDDFMEDVHYVVSVVLYGENGSFLATNKFCTALPTVQRRSRLRVTARPFVLEVPTPAAVWSPNLNAQWLWTAFRFGDQTAAGVGTSKTNDLAVTRRQDLLCTVDPVPGGCNLVFEVENSPYQRVSYDRRVVKVQVQQASASNIICEADAVKLDMYYMPFIDSLTEEHHFDAIKKMATVKDIEQNGIKVPDALMPPILLRSYVNYIGTGRVFGVVAHWKNSSSAYVPIVSYGCDISRGADSCHKEKAAPIVVVVLYFMVSLAAFMEKRKTTAFLCAIICSTHFIIAIDYIDSTYLLVTLSILGVILALSACYYFDNDKFNAAVVSYWLGCFFTSLFTHFSSISQVTINYWSVFLTTSIICFLFMRLGKYEINRSHLVVWGWSLGYSVMMGGYLNFYITNSLLYFTTHYYQPIVADVIETSRDYALIVASFISYLIVRCILSCLYRRYEANTERTPLIASTTIIVVEREP